MYPEAEDQNTSQTLQPMREKVVLVSGATSGIGEASARALAEKGATVVVIGRDALRAQATVADIRSTSSNQSIDFLVADLSSLAQVQKLAVEFQSKYERLDVLINNVGAVFFTRQTSVDGYEMTFALNHLSYFLLTNLLLERLKTTAAAVGEARIVNVSSEAHRGAKMFFDDLMFERRSYGYGGLRAYSQSKLANILFTFELSRRLEGSQVIANALHPGLVASNIGKNNGKLGQIYARVARRLGINSSEGAQTVVYLASWPEVKGNTQKYYRQCQSVQADPAAYDLASAQKLWEISEALVA